MEYKYIFADPDAFVAMAMKNNQAVLDSFVSDLQAKYPGKVLVFHFDSAMLKLSLHYNDVYESMRRRLQDGVIVCE